MTKIIKTVYKNEEVKNLSDRSKIKTKAKYMAFKDL